MTTAQKRRPRRHFVSKFLLVVLLLGSVGALFWFGLVPQRLSPFPPLSLSEPDQWFVDVRLASLRRDRLLCAATLTSPHIQARPVADNPIKDGCGWHNAVRLDAAGGAELPAGTVTCEMAAALSLWVEHDVQPLAMRHMGARIDRVEHMGGYACRNIIGSKTWKGFKSQHATANAVDISGFRLADGRMIRIRKDWSGDTASSRFLHAAHRAACRYFRVAIGPDFNTAHHDHFHFDRGPLTTCR